MDNNGDIRQAGIGYKGKSVINGIDMMISEPPPLISVNDNWISYVCNGYCREYCVDSKIKLLITKFVGNHQ